MSTPRNRAAVVVTAVLHVISTALRDATLRQQLEELLRDELADVERQAAAERETPHD